MDNKVLIKVENLKQWFPVKKTKFREVQRYVRANDGISIDIYDGETLGLVGESGCGKSTFGRSLLQLYTQTAGKTTYNGLTVDSMSPNYIVKILSHLNKELATLDSFEKNYKKLNDAITESSNAEERAELRKAKKAYDLKFNDLASILGGFMIVDDIEVPAKELATTYDIAAKIHDLDKELLLSNAIVNKLEANIEAKKDKSTSSLEAKLIKAKKEREDFISKLDAKKTELANQIEVLNKLRDKYLAVPELKDKFAEYESYKSEGIDLTKLSVNEMREIRKDMQLIFQDPYSSLNPRMTVGQIISEGLTAHNIFLPNDPSMQDYVMKVMEDCGLSSYMIHRYPHQFSGGQRQRIGIARSLALKPKFVVCDEAVSALDVSIQSQIINLLKDLKEKENLTYLFISHDLSVVKYISDRIGVMYLGNIVELSKSESLFERPLHPYTMTLLKAIPTTDVNRKKKLTILEGDIPSPVSPPPGCKFHTRCRFCQNICKIEEPELVEALPNRFVACHFPLLDDSRDFD